VNTFKDIFKSDFLNTTTLKSFSLTDTVIALVLACLLGLFIFLIYKATYNGVMYSPTFGASLIAICMVTTLVILAVTSNIVLSLGMVGALSIVRFRAAIKEPMDIAFLFWAIASGIVLGAGLIPMAIVGAVLIGVALVILCNFGSLSTKPYILVVRCRPECETQVTKEICKNTTKQNLKARRSSHDGIELIFEVRTKTDQTKWVDDLKEYKGVDSAELVSYNGEYMS